MLVWNGILVAVFSLSGYRYLGDGGTDQHEILHDGTYRSRTDLPFGGGTPGIPKSKILGVIFWPFDCGYLETGNSQHYVSLRA